MNIKQFRVKKFIILILLCSTCILHGQRKPKIKGNKAVTDIREDLPPFNAIELNDDLEITLQKSYDVGYTITADDNLIDVLKFKVEDSTLVISSFYKITGKKKLDITVNYRELRALTMRDGKINMKDVINTDHLRVNTFGTSKLELNASAPVIDITMEGNSSGNFNLDSDSLTVSLKDRIDVNIYAVCETNTLEMFKNAAASIEGTVDTLRLHLYGSANLKAQKFEAAIIRANLEETPTARVYAFKEMELSSRGSSKTYFYGTGRITLLDFLDTSELYKGED